MQAGMKDNILKLTMERSFLLVIFILHCSQFAFGSCYCINLDCSRYTSEKVIKFWTNTGFSPPGPNESARQFLTSSDVRTNLYLIGSLPFNGVVHVRIHWLLELITVEGATKNLSDNITLNFSLLDDVLNTLNDSQLLPGFEIMGFPRGLPANSLNSSFWNELTSQVLKRYVDKFGIGKVKNWRLEMWNEPDLRMYNILNFTSSDYIDYIKGVLSAVNQFRLRVGGPAGLFKNPIKHKLCWSFLDYCNLDPRLCNLSFISYHKKGNSDVKGIISGTKFLFKEISANYSSLTSIPFANSESDFLTGWWRNTSWRADVRYAAAMAESVMIHMKLFKKAGLKLSFISHDNGFLNFYPHFFTQRTLVARFQMNNTEPSYSQFFRKPGLNVLILLALLEDYKIPIKNPQDKKLKIIATRSNFISADARISILIVFNDAIKTGPKSNFQIFMKLPPMKRAKYNILVLDNALPNPSSVWKNSGSPVFPDKILRDNMRRSQEVNHVELGSVTEKMTLNISLQLSMPSITLIHICSQTHSTPGKVTNVRFLNVTFNEVLIMWSDQEVLSKCLKTYEVHFYPGTCSVLANFSRINNQDSLFLSYQFAPLNFSPLSELVPGCYRVRAVDYWDRPGFFSDPLQY